MFFPKITIIVPVYNTACYIKQCLECLIRQSYNNLEIILINDGSKDNSGSICDIYASKDDRIRVIHKENQGVSIARNIGLELATGDFVSFVDSDDYLEYDCYEQIVNIIHKEDCDMVVFDYFINYPTKEIRHQTPSDYMGYITNEKKLKLILLSINPFPVTKIYSRKCFNFVRFPCNIHWGEDSIYAYEAMEKAERIFLIPNNLYHYVQSENSTTRNEIFNPRLVSGLKMADYFIEVCKDRYPHLLSLAYEKLIDMLSILTIDTFTLSAKNRYRKYVKDKNRDVLCKLLLFPRISLKRKFKLFLIALMPQLFIILHKKVLH